MSEILSAMLFLLISSSEELSIFIKSSLKKLSKQSAKISFSRMLLASDWDKLSFNKVLSSTPIIEDIFIASIVSDEETLTSDDRKTLIKSLKKSTISYFFYAFPFLIIASISESAASISL